MRVALLLTTTAAVVCLMAWCASAAPPVPPTPLKITLMGDSITEGSDGTHVGSFRDDFYHKLINNGYTHGSVPGKHFDLVGSRYILKSDDDPNSDADCMAMGSQSVENLYWRFVDNWSPRPPNPPSPNDPNADPSHRDWSAFGAPDVVCLLAGTIDISRINTASAWRTAEDIPGVIADFKTLLGGLRARNAAVTILLSTGIPSSNSTRTIPPETNTVSVELLKNALIAAYNNHEFDANGSPIYLVDHWTGFDANTMTSDGTHPNATGQTLISDRYYQAIIDHNLPIPEPATMAMLGAGAAGLLLRRRRR